MTTELYPVVRQAVCLGKGKLLTGTIADETESVECVRTCISNKSALPFVISASNSILTLNGNPRRTANPGHFEGAASLSGTSLACMQCVSALFTLETSLKLDCFAVPQKARFVTT